MMNWTWRAAIAGLVLFPVGSQAVAATPAIAPMTYQTRTLSNGLKVYSIRDPNSANVSVQVWYDVGSRDDPRGRSGFAHLFEHLMFKSTRNMVPEQFDRLTEDVGGFNNASTYDDFTNYYEVVPANHLQRLLWAEAERMQSLVIEPGFFASERDVVKEELRSRVLAAPYGKLFYLYLPQISYDVHPYARPGIGSIADLDAATIEDVRAFHAAYYRPDNAVLVVAGNFEQAQLDRWVDQYFQPIARPSSAVPRTTIEEPERREARRFTVYEPNTPLPAVLLTFQIPPANHEDSAALEVADAILSRGESSRLHQSLVYRDQVASQTGTILDSKQGQGVLGIYAILSGGKAAEAGESAVRREVGRLRDGAVAPAELDEAKAELLTAALRERETVEGQANALAKAVVVDRDAEAVNRRLAQIAAVTAADVQRVAQRWLRDERSAAVRYLPESEQKSEKEDVIDTPSTVRTAVLSPPPNIRVWQPAPESQRVAPPPPGPEIIPSVPEPNVQRLANGLTVVTVEDHGLPLVTAHLVATGGSAEDPAGRAGTAGLTASVMTEGTTSRSATDIDRAVEALGSSLGGGAGWDGAQVNITVGTNETEKALEIIADIARNATLPAEEIERQRAVAIDGVKVAMSDPGEIARMTAARALFGDGAYGHPAVGTEKSLSAIARGDIESAYRRTWTPMSATLIMSGDVTPARARALAERHLGDWVASRDSEVPSRVAANAPMKSKLIVVDLAGSGQAAVAVTREGLTRRDPRYYPLLVANAVLGGGYSARLNQEIRIKRGLSYGSGSNLDARRNPGPFIAVTQTRNDAADQVLDLTLREMRKIGSEPVSTTELVARRASLTGSFGRNIETTSGVASLIAGYLQRGIPPATLNAYLPSVVAVTSEEVREAAAQLLNSDGSTVVIVGDSKLFIDKLRGQFDEVQLIPISDLDLDSPNLRRGAN